VVHIGRPEIVAEVSEALVQEYGDVEILSAPATPVIATHVGHGAWAVAFQVED
jgi:fatty acid-binding protein DegV